MAWDRLRAAQRAGIGDPLDPDGADLYYIGGGQDRDQKLCADDLAERQARRAAGGRRPRRRRARGVRRLPAARATPTSSATRRCPASASSTCARSAATGPRLIGNVAIEVELEPAIAPTCSPASRTTAAAPRLGPAERAARTGAERPRQQRPQRLSRACARGNVIGTYLHGPLLPKNAWFADWLIATALGTRAGWRHSTTSSSRPPTPRRAAPPGV